MTQAKFNLVELNSSYDECNFTKYFFIYYLHKNYILHQQQKEVNAQFSNNKILKLDLNLFSRYFAGGSDDGSVYLYDLRKPCTGYVSRLMGGSSKHTSLNGYNRSPITDVAFHSVKSNILVVSTLEGEILRFE